MTGAESSEFSQQSELKGQFLALKAITGTRDEIIPMF